MINKEQIKRQIEKAINTLPTQIVLKRKPKIEDGMGGYTVGKEITVSEFTAFLDLSNSYRLDLVIQESGTIDRIRKPQLISVYNDSFEILEDDYFTVGKKKYLAVNPINLFDIAWQCELEVV